jgi:hypothetical protein
MVEHTCIIISIFSKNITTYIYIYISMDENFKIGHAFGVMAACHHCSFLSPFLFLKQAKKLIICPIK